MFYNSKIKMKGLQLLLPLGALISSILTQNGHGIFLGFSYVQARKPYGFVRRLQETAEDDGDMTTKSERIVKESYSLVPNANSSQHTNFTLLDEDVSKKIILEMWVERKDPVATDQASQGAARRLEEGQGGATEMIYQLNGAIYLVNQNVFQQTSTGAMDFKIYIGMHDAAEEKQVSYEVTEIVDGEASQVQKEKTVAPQDWLLLKFNLADKTDREGKWECVDGYSDFSQASHSIESAIMNAEDTAQNDCVINKDLTKVQIGNSKLTTKVSFMRLFKTGDSSGNDIEIKPGQPLTFKVTVIDQRQIALENPLWLTDFVYQIPNLEQEHDLTEITLIIIGLLLASFTIILVVRYIELRGEKQAKQLVIKNTAPSYKL